MNKRLAHRAAASWRRRARSLSCADQFCATVFAQLTWREGLRDIEASLSAIASKLYAMGLRSAVGRSTLVDANESRDRHIWSNLASLLIRRSRKLCVEDASLVRRDCLCTDRHGQKGTSSRCLLPHIATDFFGTAFEKIPLLQALADSGYGSGDVRLVTQLDMFQI